jgi:UDP-N-acetylglucosamine--N-acetylmuramyl-(pentapeptide) pyrophosphoryl-undecaprenol N-acetylglucosamine transferase
MKKIALTGWWTWWHIFPLVALYNSLKDDKNLSFIWFGEQDWLEEEIAWQNDIPFKHIPAGKLRRYFDIRNIYEPFKNISWIIWWVYYLLFYKIDIIFSKWWYVSLPLCIAGFILRKKIYIHESDTVCWLANKLIWKIATKVFYTFPNANIDGQKHICVWQILNQELLSNIDQTKNGKENEKLEVLVIAGSQWSTIIFENLKMILDNLIDIHFTIILWEKNLHFRADFEKFKNVTIHDFVSQKKMWEIYKKTDIAISRAGSTSLWELYFFWIHAIIIPLLWSAQNHQFYNAKYFRENFWSNIVKEWEDLSLEIFRILTKYKDLRKNGLNLEGFSYACDQIKKEI